MPILLDTGPLVALLNQRDTHHAWSLEQFAQHAAPLYTCEAVLTEAHFLLQPYPPGRTRLIDVLRRGRLDCTFSYAQHQERVDDLMLKYQDLPMSFADACLVCMAEQMDGTVFTLDRHFLIYRQHGNQSLPVLMP